MGRRAYFRPHSRPMPRARSRCCSRVAAPARAADPTLATRLAKALAVPHVDPARTAALAIDLRTGPSSSRGTRRLSLVPASNQKLPVAYAALALLGPGYRFHTEVLGSGTLVGDVWHGDLWLRGLRRPDAGAVRPRRASPPRSPPGGSGASTAPWSATSPGSTRAGRRRAGSRASTSTSRRRSPRSPSTAAWYRGHTSASPALAAAIAAPAVARGRRRQGRGANPRRRADDVGPTARARRLRAARRRSSASWAARATTTPPRCSLKQLGATYARRGLHGRRTRASSAPRSARRASRSPACASPTARASRASTA